jgi:NAD(P)-dependent dehydrogenase (short-subunit alcohol dehydrogenase family)
VGAVHANGCIPLRRLWRGCHEHSKCCGAAKACLERQGLPDVVIANAGVSWGVDTSLREDLEVMQQVLASNTMGLAASFQPFIAPMVRRGSGRLVGICSVAGIRGLPGHAAYSASKAAAIAYWRVCALSCRKSGSL